MAVSPLDGRYASKLSALGPFYSEYALIRYRIMVEIHFFITLSEEKKVTQLSELSKAKKKEVLAIIDNFTEKEAQKIKDIEKTTNHDVKAVEYYLKEKFKKIGLTKQLEFIHFACTSEDINNLAYALMLKDGVEQVVLPTAIKVQKEVQRYAKKWQSIALLSKTHGQPASPTTVGKEFLIFSSRLSRQIDQLKKQEYLGKLNGATGNYNAHAVAYPDVNWIGFTKKLMKKLKLTPNFITPQIEPHDYMAELFDVIRRINTIILDLDRDIWIYISNGIFKQKLKAGEIGSSTMPHKVNPIDFENSEGNIGLANAMLQHLSNKLPVSRLQRDLTDSTVQRNIGSALGYSVLAYTSTLKGLSKLELNKTNIADELNNNWEVLAEAVQTVMRKHAIENPYEKLKELTRGKRVDGQMMKAFISALKLPKEEKDRLMALTPATYIGQVEKLFEL